MERKEVGGRRGGREGGRREEGGGALTFGRLDAVDVGLELVDRLDVLVLLYTVVDDTSTFKNRGKKRRVSEYVYNFVWRKQCESDGETTHQPGGTQPHP